MSLRTILRKEDSSPTSKVLYSGWSFLINLQIVYVINFLEGFLATLLTMQNFHRNKNMFLNFALKIKFKKWKSKVQEYWFHKINNIIVDKIKNINEQRKETYAFAFCNDNIYTLIYQRLWLFYDSIYVSPPFNSIVTLCLLIWQQNKEK